MIVAQILEKNVQIVAIPIIAKRAISRMSDSPFK
jgi:hypothetical protein